VDVAALLSSQPLPKGRRVALLTNAGGLGILAADACEAAGLELPGLADGTRAALEALLPPEASLANPIDMLGSATEGTFESVLPHVLSDPGIDSVIVLFVPPVVANAKDVATAVVRAAEASPESEKPVLGVFISHGGTPSALIHGKSRVTGFPFPESAARALGRVVERAEWLRRPAGTIPALERIDRPAAEEIVRTALRDSDEIWLDPAQVRQLLGAYGIEFVAERYAATVDEAIAAAESLGYPVVVKTAEPGAHKTEKGLLALDLASDADVGAAARRIGLPVVVQPMLKGGAELLAGVVQDPVFGPLVAFGPGGVLAELIGDATFRIAPLTDVDALELVTTGKAGRLVSGFRGAPPSDTSALSDLVLRLSRLADDIPEIGEIDLNPVLGLPSGYVAVDARVLVRTSARVRRTKSW
jgi:acyl-CoA synthetase (NDP forming)